MTGTEISPTVAQFRAGTRNLTELLAVPRHGVLILPISEADDLLVRDALGLGWVCAFTSLSELARFARDRHANTDSRPYVSMCGAMVHDHVLVDVSGAHPRLLPPAGGVVLT